MESVQRYTDILVRRSNQFVAFSLWEAVEKIFPSLFPGGCGGPTEPRAVKMSIRDWIRRCMKIANQRFEHHNAFMLLAFDFLAMQAAKRALHVKLHVSTQALLAGSISRETILQSIDYFNHLIQATQRELRPNRFPSELRDMIDIRKGLESSESAFYGSSLSRTRARHDIFGYLQRFGIFQKNSVSPDSAGNYIIAERSGVLQKETIDMETFYFYRIVLREKL